MFWLWLFWIEAIAVPAVFLHLALASPDGAPYRTLNLVIWGVALVGGIGGFGKTRMHRRRDAG